MELAWQFGCPVTELMDRMPSYELAWWKAFSKLRHDEHEEERVKAEARGRARSKGGTMGRR